MPDFEDKIPISEFSYTNSLNNTDQMPIIQQDGAAWDNFRTSLADVGLHVNKVTQYTTDLHTTNDTIIGAINELADGGGSADITSEIDTPAPIMTFNDGGDNIPLKSLVTEIVPIQSGSGVPSPSNVRSISGVSDINLYCAGKNIYPLDYSHASQTISGINFSFNDDGSVEMTGTATANTYPYAVMFRLPAGTYKKSSAVNDIGILIQYVVSSSSWSLLSSAPETEFTVTPEISQYTIVARVRVPNGKVLDHYKYYPFIYLGSETDLSFEKYIGQIKNIPLGQTVYGGSLECVSGSGVSEWVNIDSYAGETIEEPWLCSQAPFVSGTTPPTGSQVVYKTSTPTSLSVSGANIPTLSGENNIYTDCGDIQSLEYFNDNADDIADLDRAIEYHKYSTVEKVVGKWLDGSTVYEKTISVNPSDLTSDETTLLHGISGLNFCIEAKGFLNRNSQTTIPIPIYHADSRWALSVYDITSTSYHLYVGSNQRNSNITSIYLTFRYTKT